MRWMPDGGSGNRWRCMSACLGARGRACHHCGVSPRGAGGNPGSASWDEERGDNEVEVVSGGQRSCWHPGTG